MSHLKRQQIPTQWPIGRKGSVYVVKSNFGTKEGVPVLIALRDMLKIVKDRKEAKQTIHSRHILLNEKPVVDEKHTILLMDTFSVIPLKKYYRLELSEKGKFYFDEIKENEASKKVSKIVNKKTLKGKKTQLNLSDGRNFLTDMKCNVNDSVIVNLKDSKIEKCLPIKEKAKAIVFAGKHIGEKGEIEKLNLDEKRAVLKIGGKETNILIKQLMVTE
jgi:small subunit ribosomal protein S4e